MVLSAATGTAEAGTLAAVIHWLLTPMSGAQEHVISPWVAWHGRLMVLGMAVLLPPVIVVARYFKVTPRQDWPRQLDNPFWFVMHRRWGHIVGIVVAAGLAVVIPAIGMRVPWQNFHVATGWTVVALVFVQLVGSWLRGSHGGPVDPFTRKRRPPHEWPGDHFSMTRRRLVFEYAHKSAGYVLLGLTFAAIPSGLVAADAPRWMPIVIAIWWIMVAAVSVRLQWAGRCIDTYQAIWGPDPDLPGNRRRPIGFGITRLKVETIGASRQ